MRLSRLTELHNTQRVYIAMECGLKTQACRHERALGRGPLYSTALLAGSFYRAALAMQAYVEIQQVLTMCAGGLPAVLRHVAHWDQARQWPKSHHYI